MHMCSVFVSRANRVRRAEATDASCNGKRSMGILSKLSSYHHHGCQRLERLVEQVDPDHVILMLLFLELISSFVIFYPHVALAFCQSESSLLSSQRKEIKRSIIAYDREEF